MAYNLSRQASLRTVQGDAEAGWALVREGLEVARQAAVWDRCLQRLCGTGIWNGLEAGDLASVEELVRKATNLEEERRMCTVCSLQMHPALAAEELDNAGAYAKKAHQIAEIGHNQAGHMQVLRVRGEIHAMRGEMAEAVASLARGRRRPFESWASATTWSKGCGSGTGCSPGPALGRKEAHTPSQDPEPVSARYLAETDHLRAEGLSG